jgi:hypothetical protein
MKKRKNNTDTLYALYLISSFEISRAVFSFFTNSFKEFAGDFPFNSGDPTDLP